MSIFAKVICVGIVGGIMLAATPGAALADDFVAQCKAGEGGNADAEKTCKCLSDKLGDKRSAVLVLMKAGSEATAKNTPLDPSTFTGDQAAAWQAFSEALVGCAS
jgi:hypothetical protein